MNQLAKGSFSVTLTNLVFEGADADSKLARMAIDKTISGDLVATTQGQMLSAMGQVAGSAGYVAIERVSGELQGRRGSFVLQHRGVMDRSQPTMSITVVPDSGTDELVGLSGDFSISMVDGEHTYEFSYQLDGAA